MVKARYEHSRLAVETFFGAETEATDKKEWTVFYLEGLDVYDMDPGHKYFRHQKLSIAHAQRTKASQLLHIGSGVGLPEESLAQFQTQSSTPSFDLETVALQPEWNDLVKTPLGMEQTMRGDNLEAIPFPSTPLERPPSWDTTQAEAALVENLEPMAPSAEQSFGDQYFNNLFDELENYINTSRDDPLGIPYDSPQGSASCSTHVSRQENPSLQHVHSGQATGKTLNDMRDRIPQPAWQTKPSMPPTDSKITAPTDSASMAKPQGRKIRRRESAGFDILEDNPGSTPEIQRLIAHFPLSPGIDVPKENLGSQERFETSDEIREPQTPRSLRRRSFNVTPTHSRQSRPIFGGGW